MKGVMAQITPGITVVDLTHAVPPQAIAVARFHLMTAYPYFPQGTVHVAVVDPGVGSQRRAIAVQLETGFLVGPDNGLFSGVLQQYPALAAVELTNARYWRTAAPSTTFHGRDIFAPAGAYLAQGVSLEQLGTPIPLDTLVELPLAACVKTPNGLAGVIQASDRFGNLITNIPAEQLQGTRWSIIVGEQTIPAAQTYAEHPPGTLLALVGSHGWVEIAANRASAQERLKLTIGDPVTLVYRL